MSQDSRDSRKGFSVNVSGWRGGVGWVRQKKSWRDTQKLDNIETITCCVEFGFYYKSNGK